MSSDAGGAWAAATVPPKDGGDPTGEGDRGRDGSKSTEIGTSTEPGFSGVISLLEAAASNHSSADQTRRRMFRDEFMNVPEGRMCTGEVFAKEEVGCTEEPRISAIELIDAAVPKRDVGKENVAPFLSTAAVGDQSSRTSEKDCALNFRSSSSCKVAKGSHRVREENIVPTETGIRKFDGAAEEGSAPLQRIGNAASPGFVRKKVVRGEDGMRRFVECPPDVDFRAEVTVGNAVRRMHSAFVTKEAVSPKVKGDTDMGKLVDCASDLGSILRQCIRNIRSPSFVRKKVVRGEDGMRRFVECAPNADNLGDAKTGSPSSASNGAEPAGVARDSPGPVPVGAAPPAALGQTDAKLWLREEKERFLLGLHPYGRGHWKRIQTEVRTRTNKQIKSHAQKREKANPEIKLKYAKGKIWRGRIASRVLADDARAMVAVRMEASALWDADDGTASLEEAWNGDGPDSRARTNNFAGRATAGAGASPVVGTKRSARVMKEEGSCEIEGGRCDSSNEIICSERRKRQLEAFAVLPGPNVTSGLGTNLNKGASFVRKKVVRDENSMRRFVQCAPTDDNWLGATEGNAVSSCKETVAVHAMGSDTRTTDAFRLHVAEGIIWKQGDEDNSQEACEKGRQRAVKSSESMINGAEAKSTIRSNKGEVCARRGAERKRCSHKGCSNYAKTGGVCIRHGAKVKRCNHEGCSNNVYKGGVCMKHGAVRKRCSHEGCSNRAIKGGVCLRHGAVLKRCNHEGCTNLARKGGVCMRHYSQKIQSGRRHQGGI